MTDALFLELQEALKGRYSLLHELGRGGMGIVYLAREVRLDRLVALKILPPDRAASALRDRFLREARTAARLSQPNIIPIHAVDEVGDFVFFAMAYVDGESLAGRLTARGSLPAAEAARMLRDVAWALAYAHAQGVVHRDIKPDNILIERGSNRPMVADFGIAHVAQGSAATAVGQVLGTPEYMSPEQASGETVDGRSDIYSLGVVGFLALSGRLPFEGANVSALLAKHISQPAPALLSLAPDVPAKLARAIDRCLCKAPDERHASAEALAEALDSAVEQPRQLPVPLERWLLSGDELRLRHVAVAPLITTPVMAMISLALGGTPFGGGGLEIDSLVLFVAGLAGPFLVYAIHRLSQTRRALANGFAVEDLRLAVNAWLARNALTEREQSLRQTPLDRIGRWSLESGFGVGLVVLGAGVTRACATNGDDWLNSLFYGSYTAIAAAVVVARLARGPGRNLSSLLERLRARFWAGRLSRWITKLAGLGLKADTAQLAHRPTEVALGSAGEALFEALPKDLRQQLGDIPKTIRRLEARAQAIRGRIAELAALQAAGEAGSARTDGTELAVRRQALQADVLAQQRGAEQLLADVVTALETIRIDLLRLTAGAVSATTISADIAAAEAIGGEIDAAVEGQAAIEKLLGPAPTPA